MKKEEMKNRNPEEQDPGSLSDAELIEQVAGCALPELTLSALRNYSPEEWEKLEHRIGTDGARALAAVLELGRRMEEEND